MGLVEELYLGVGPAKWIGGMGRRSEGMGPALAGPNLTKVLYLTGQSSYEIKSSMNALPNKQEALMAVPRRLSEWLGPTSVSLDEGSACDELIQVDNIRFAVTYKADASRRSLEPAVWHIRRTFPPHDKSIIPLLVVPYMGDLGQGICQEAGVSWLDLSGNANIIGPRLRLIIKGEPNQYKHQGRPASVFAPKSSRIARWLLMRPHHAFMQRELAHCSKLDEGYTSRLVKRLRALGYLRREKSGVVMASRPAQMLADWRSEYEFGQHEIIKGHITARGPDELVTKISKHLGDDMAFTALAAAAHQAPFAGYRLVTAYVNQRPEESTLNGMGFREEPRGANIWLVIPNDEGVFHGSNANHNRCVHPIQAYLDLKDHPERSSEAAEHLLKTVILPSFEKVTQDR